MKVVFTLNRKTGELDWFIRNDPGPLPPIVNPPKSSEPKDGEPPKPDKPEPKPS
jgi:hypothetical protein